MKTFRILMYEDSIEWKEGFEFSIKPKLEHQSINIEIYHRYDNSTIAQDIEVLPHLILVDYDLEELTGTEIIEQIEGDPQYQKTSIFFYSGGESIDSLAANAKENLRGGVSCYTKEGDDLENAVIRKAKSI